MISGNMVGSYSNMGKTFILQDENGNEITGVIVGQEVLFTAGDNDVREGMVYASDTGISTGTKEIPAYYTSEGFKVVPNGSSFTLSMPDYEYTKLQAIFCPFNTSMANSVAAEKVALENCVYPVQSTVAEAVITLDHEKHGVDFNITNNSGKIYLIRYFSYKEIY